jgi:hypothetical protein
MIYVVPLPFQRVTVLSYKIMNKTLLYVQTGDSLYYYNPFSIFMQDKN